MKENRLIIVIIVLIILIAGVIGVIAFMSSQNHVSNSVFINNSTNDTNVSDNVNSDESSVSVNAKFFCEKCSVWVLKSDRKVHGERYHQFKCDICGKKVWEDGSHVDGSSYHTAKEYDENDRKHGYNQYTE